MIYDGKRLEVVSPVGFEKAVDMHAASDAFGAALTLEYLNYLDIKHATRCALAASAITASRYGSATSIPTRSELMALLDGSL